MLIIIEVKLSSFIFIFFTIFRYFKLQSSNLLLSKQIFIIQCSTNYYHFPYFKSKKCLNQLEGSLHHTTVYYMTCLGHYCFRSASLEAAPLHILCHSLNQLGGSLHDTEVYNVTCLGHYCFRLGSNYSLEYLTYHTPATSSQTQLEPAWRFITSYSS